MYKRLKTIFVPEKRLLCSSRSSSLVKKDSETAALKVKQLVEKGWCNETAPTENLNYKAIFTKGFPKNPQNFPNKIHLKLASTVSAPSMPFHTQVKLVDAEDIANEKIRTHDLTLQVNNITNTSKHKPLIHDNEIKLCLHSLEITITKLNLL